jgi:hypothetical protein
MITLTDEKRIARNLRKQFLKIKGKLWILGLYKDKKVVIKKLSDAGSEILDNQINQKRAVYNAITKGFKLCVVENHVSSDVKLIKILDWGVQYGNQDVTTKRIRRKGKYYIATWVKGRKGIVSFQRARYSKAIKIENTANDLGLVVENDIWNDKY